VCIKPDTYFTFPINNAINQELNFTYQSTFNTYQTKSEYRNADSRTSFTEIKFKVFKNPFCF
jgi:hypothetical protein